MTKRKILLAADKLNYVATLNKNNSPVTFRLKRVTGYKHGNVSDVLDLWKESYGVDWNCLNTFPHFFEVSLLHLVCRSFWERIN